jgi:anti-anti-sigma regulatory factor/HAMP domain-containing protein
MLRLRTRFVLSGVIAVVLVIGLVTLFVVERRNYTDSLVLVDAAHNAALEGRELAVATQYNAHDTNAYALGHLEHREEFAEHAERFARSFTALQDALDAGLLDEDTVERLDTIRQVREAYTAAADRLFRAADTQRASPSPANQATLDAAWEVQDGLGDQLDATITDLADDFLVDAKRLEAEAEARGQWVLWLLGGAGGFIALLLLGVQLFSADAVGRPMAALLAGVERLTRGEYNTRVEAGARNEVGILGRAVNTMAETIEEQTRGLREQYAVAEAARLEAERTQQHIAEQLATIEQQAGVIREMSVPVLPVSNDTLVMPLIGALDTARLGEVQEQALQAIERNHTRHFLLDLTGVLMVDSQVAQGLLRVVQAARMLGAQVTLIGIRPEVAQSMVTLGVEGSTFHTARDLQTAFRPV